MKDRLWCEISQVVAVFFHVLVVFGHCQADQPDKVDQEKGPVDRNKKDLETRAETGEKANGCQTLPKIKFIEGSEDGSISFWTL